MKVFKLFSLLFVSLLIIIARGTNHTSEKKETGSTVYKVNNEGQ
jgi:hypothetical protein